MLFVGIGGTGREQSSSESALRIAMQPLTDAGHRVRLYTGARLDLPLYDPTARSQPPAAQALVEDLRAADGVVISSPGYHGSVSGRIKNALDYVEELADDRRTYLSGRAVGCVSVAAGAQAAVGTLHSLRTIVHALRGWPTPYGAAVDLGQSPIVGGKPADLECERRLRLVGCEVLDFAATHAAHPSAWSSVEAVASATA